MTIETRAPDRQVPFDEAAEQQVLGSLLSDRDAIFKVVDLLRVDDFFIPRHQRVYAAAQALLERRERIDSLTIQVVGSPAPVATVAVIPGSASLAVGDSAGFRAELRDSGGNVQTDRPVSWFVSDSAVVSLLPFGSQAIVRARTAGTAVLSATSEGKTGRATITVH